jgi:vitamin B12 transporter
MMKDTNMRFTHNISALALAIASLSTPALAEDEQKQDGDIVVTATGIAQPSNEVGQTISVLDADTILTRQQPVIADLFATIPGIRISRNGSIGGVTGVSIRGAETTQTLVLLDGVKINDPSGIGDLFDFGSLLTGNIQRIEVLRGSNSVVHGSQAIGGVVNLTTVAPAADLVASASAGYGFADTIDAKADVSAGHGMVSGGAGIAWFRTDGISSYDRALGGAERDGVKNLAANGRLSFAFTPDISLDLRGYYIHADTDIDGFASTFPFSLTDTADRVKSNQYIGYAGLNAALLDGVLRNRLSATWFRSERDNFASATAATPDFGYRGTAARFEYQGVLQPIDQAKLVFGYEHEAPRYAFDGFGSSDRFKANIDSLYGLVVAQPVEGLTVTGGVRHIDHNNPKFGSATIWGANANWRVGSSTHVRYAYGEGFKTPSLYQFYDPFSGSDTLRPERSRSHDVGIDQSVGDGVATLSLTAFTRSIRDQIDFSNTTFTYGNLARTRTQGIEAAVALHPVEDLDLTAAYSHIDARDRTPGATFDHRLARRAADQVSVAADYRWSFGLSTGATVTYVGDSFENLSNTTRLNGYALANIRVRFPITDRLEVYGRVDNLFNQRYQTAFRYGSYPRAAYAGIRLTL